MFEPIRHILTSKAKIALRFPYTNKFNNSYFGDGELSDILSFGFSYVEQNDHCVEYILITPKMAKRIIKEIDAFNLTVNLGIFGMLWTAHVVLTDKIDNNIIVFSNADSSIVLCLDTNKIGVQSYAYV